MKASRLLVRINQVVFWMFTAATCFFLFMGWHLREHDLITPKRGLGFVFGILGTLMMTVLLLYPLRKRVKGTEAIGGVKPWFRVHMILGILGPVMILFHANFHLGATNSNVALFCMLIVSSSGVVGRYLYSRIHQGLYGQKMTLVELKKGLEFQKEEADEYFAVLPESRNALGVFVMDHLRAPHGLGESFLRLCTVRFKAYALGVSTHRLSEKYFNALARQEQWSAEDKKKKQEQMRQKVDTILDQTIRVVEFNMMERLFGLWHMLHLPLVFVMGFAIILHILAVNRY